MEVIKGPNLKLLLKRKGITSAEICSRLNMNPTTVSRYFTDSIAMPATFLIKVAAFANLEIADLIIYESDETRNVANEPRVEYKKGKIPPPPPTEITIMVEGVPIAEKLHKIEKEMVLVLEKLNEMEKKSKIKYKELEHA